MSEILEERDGWRVRLETDPDPQQPDGDYLPLIIEMQPSSRYEGGARIELRGGPYKMEIPDWISDVLTSLAFDWDNVERALYAGGVLSFDRISWDRGTLVAIVTPEVWQVWNGQGAAADPDDPDVKASAGEACKEWESYRDGDVYGHVIERLTLWTSDQGEERVSWDEVDSCWGFYGYEYAQAAAREYFAAYPPKTTS